MRCIFPFFPSKNVFNAKKMEYFLSIVCKIAQKVSYFIKFKIRTGKQWFRNEKENCFPLNARL